MFRLLLSRPIDNRKILGAKLLYLPPYSPNLNPIEQAFVGSSSALSCNYVFWHLFCLTFTHKLYLDCKVTTFQSRLLTKVRFGVVYVNCKGDRSASGEETHWTTHSSLQAHSKLIHSLKRGSSPGNALPKRSRACESWQSELKEYSMHPLAGMLGPSKTAHHSPFPDQLPTRESYLLNQSVETTFWCL